MSLADALALPPRGEDNRIPIDPALLDQNEDLPTSTIRAKDEPQDEEMGDLFGDGTGTPQPADTADEDGLTSSQRRQRQAMEYDEDEDEPPEVQLRDASVQIPNIPMPKSSDANYWVLRLPSFVRLDSKPFHPDTYVGPEQEEDDSMPHLTDSLKERSLSVKLEVENTVRWRWVKGENGEDRKQSNSRIIRWSDGSLSLQLGKELFDINNNLETSAGVSRNASSNAGTSQSSQSQSGQLSYPLRTYGLTYLVAQHKRAEVLQAEKLLTGYLSLRPTGMQSETHRKLVRAVGQKHNKVARLRMAPSELMARDAEKELAEMAKNAARKPRKGGRKVEDGLTSPKKRRGGAGKKSRDHVWSDEEGEHLVGSEGESDDGLDGRRKMKKRRRSIGEDTKKGPGEYQTDDFVVSDEEDDEEEGDGTPSKRRIKEEEEERDSLDEAEAKIAEQESKRRRKPQKEDQEIASKVEDAEDESEDKMDVESEEDDQEVGVRKASTGGRRRRVAVDEEEED